MTSDKANHILAHLTQPISPPYVPPPIPRASWQGLRRDTLLCHTPTATLWIVTSCDNQGVNIQQVEGFQLAERLTDTDWRATATFVKVRKVRKAAKPTEAIQTHGDTSC